jgi:cholesterol transport system auxiliary component
MRALAILIAFLLAGCIGNVRQTATATLDLGSAEVAWRPASLPLRGVGVFAPAWLGTSALQYRLLYSDPARRMAYTESRWAAPPGDLVERMLNRQTPAQGGGCRLRLDLDELAQVFDTPQASRTLLDARASLVAPNGDAVLLRKAFSIARPAPTADARGGVAAAAAAVQALGGELGAWLEQAARDNPAVAARCREN